MERRLRFELLYGKHAAAVKAYVLRRVDPSMADDVVAEVFVVCWRRLEELPADALPWLLGIARRVLSTHRRGERRRAALGERLAQVSHSELAAPAPVLCDGVVAAALRRLGETDRELLLLIAWEGLSPTRAAAVLHIKPATARVRLLRARRRLSGALAEACAHEPARLPLPMEGSS